MHLGHVALLVIHVVGDVGHRGNHLHVELAAQSLLHDFHVQQPQETATESKSQRHTRLGREGERGIVELQLLERGAQVLEILGLDGIHTSKHHGLHFLKSLDGTLTRALHMGNGVAHTHFHRVLDARNDVAHIAGTQLVARRECQFEHTHLIDVIFLASVDKLHEVVLADGAVEQLKIDNDASERIEHRVKNQRLQRCLGVALGCRHTAHDGLEHRLDALAGARTHAQYLARIAAQQLHNLVLHLIGMRTVHVYLVDDRNDF